MVAMILAAGLGTRLGALGAARPKVLLEIGGRPLLEHHLDYLQANGAHRVVLNAHHHAELIEAAAASYRGPLEVIVVPEDELLGTAGGVRNALLHLNDDPFMVFYGDVVVREPVAPMFDLHRRAAAAATLAVHRAAESEGKGTVEVDAAGYATRFAEKEASAVGPALINSGIYVLDRRVVEQLEPDAFCDFGDTVLPTLIDNGERVATFRLQEPVIDIGTPEGLALARAAA